MINARERVRCSGALMVILDASIQRQLGPGRFLESGRNITLDQKA